MRETILGDPLIAGVLDACADVFLVGGFIRDLLIGTRSRDIDFIVRGDVRGLISKIFPEERATVIIFKKAMTVRVVVDDYTMDFSELRGSLEDDLSGRDFTMNAVAWSAGRGIIDPLKGREDIVKQRIRAICESNFVNDPLRLLRAYRFAGELGWRIEGKTRKIVKELAGSIKLPALERTTSESIRLLNSRYCVKAVKMAAADGLLGEIISLDAARLGDNIRKLSRLDSFIEKRREGLPISFGDEFSQGLSHIGLLRAEQLLSGSTAGKNLLRLSRASLNRLNVIGPLLSVYEKNRRINRTKLYDLLAAAGEGAMDFALLTRRKGFVREARRFLAMKGLLSAGKIMEITGVGAGPELGSLLREVRKMQFLGKLRNENDAIRWLSSRANDKIP